MTNVFAQPYRDFEWTISLCVGRFGWIALPAMLGAMVLSWWLYVPLHELFHAWGCLLAGGSVDRLEIDSAYGGQWIARLVPYVVPGSDYAGRLSGFDSHGNDAIYLATVFAPYLLTWLVGLPLARLAQRAANPLIFGAAVPWAWTPFVAVTGDYYEIGSIIASRIAAPWWPGAVLRWRSDDLPKLIGSLFGSGERSGLAGDVLGLAGSFALGVLLAFGTYQVGRWIAVRMVVRRGPAGHLS
jgi:hypothetical protein